MCPESRLVDSRRVRHAIALFIQGQIAYQNRRDAKWHVIKKFLGPFRTNTVEEVEEVESVERADPLERALANEKTGLGRLIA